MKCSSIVPYQRTFSTANNINVVVFFGPTAWVENPGVAKGFRQHGVEQLRLDGEGEGDGFFPPKGRSKSPFWKGDLGRLLQHHQVFACILSGFWIFFLEMLGVRSILGEK